MSRLILRLAAVALAVAVATSAALAQTPGASLGGATLERSVNNGGPAGTISYYRTAKQLVIMVHTYNGGQRVPPGSSNPTVTSEFSHDLADVSQQFKGSGYSDVEMPSVPSSCTYGSVTLRCITYSARSSNGARFYSKLLMTGAGGQFVKVRIDWGQALQQTGADAEAALQAFIPALLR
ncbi:MAG: hypothetical protein U1E23_07475 [Reyranellaceae bacterium]